MAQHQLHSMVLHCTAVPARHSAVRGATDTICEVGWQVTNGHTVSPVSHVSEPVVVVPELGATAGLLVCTLLLAALNRRRRPKGV